MTTDPKFQPLVDDLKNWLELEAGGAVATAAEAEALFQSPQLQIRR
jgi:hypothetical protein